MAILILAVTLGMILTTIVQAEDFLFTRFSGDSTSEPPVSVQRVGYLPESLLPDRKTSWLLPGGQGIRTSIKGGMAHIQLNSLDADQHYSRLLPLRTRLTMSVGLEQNFYIDQPNYRGYLDRLEWYDYYRPTIYFSLGHSWK